MGTKRTDDDRFIKLYQSGVKSKDICQALKCDKSTLYEVLNRNKVPLRSKFGWSGQKFNKLTFVRPSRLEEIKNMPPNPSFQN